MNFLNFCGNNALKEKLSAYGDSMPHALILEGEDGLGKHTLSNIIAAKFLCENQVEKPCGLCKNCKKILGNIHPDVITYTGGEHSRSFKVEWVREIKSNCVIMPNEARGKVYILYKADSMNIQAQNALLKVLEEPPKNVMFILCVSSAQLMLETILSRTTILTLHKVDKQDAKHIVLKNRPETTEEQFELAFSIFGGNIGKIINALTDETEKYATTIAIDIIKAINTNKEVDILRATAPLCVSTRGANSRELFRLVINRLQIFLSDALIYSYSSSNTKKDCQWIDILASRIDKVKLLKLLKYIMTIEQKIDQFINQSLVVTNMCATIREIVQK